jgi:hypothetical protein
MNNRECALAVLTKHREARTWTDEAVADELLAQLDLDPAAVAEKASLVTEEQAAAAEAAAKAAADKATSLRQAVKKPDAPLSSGQTEGAGAPIGIPTRGRDQRAADLRAASEALRVKE